MTPGEALRTQELSRRLAEAEATIAALLSGQIDAVVDPMSKTPVMLSVAQEALRQSEGRYRRIVETTNQGVWLIDTAGRTTFMNQRMVNMLGCDPADVEGAGFTTFLEQEGQAVLAQQLDAHRAGKSTQSTIRFVRKNQSFFWGLVESNPLLDEAGEYEGSFAMIVDVTERREAEDALRASEARFARLAESGILGIMTADVTGNLSEANDAFLTMTGFTREDVAGGRVRWANLDAARVHRGDGGSAATTPRERSGSPVRDGDIPQGREPRAITGRRRDAGLPELHRLHVGPDGAQESGDGALHGGEPPSTVAEDGGSRQARRRHRARLQQRALGDPQLRRPHPRRLEAEDPMRDDIEEISAAGRRAADLTRQLLMFSRQQVIEPKILDLNDVLAEHGEDAPAHPRRGRRARITSGAGSRTGQAGPEQHRAGHHEPGGERARRDAHRRHS